MICQDGSDWQPTQEQLDAWAKAYPQVDIELQLHKMNAWLVSNPDRLKTRRGMPKFCNTWLDRCQIKAEALARDKSPAYYDPHSPPKIARAWGQTPNEPGDCWRCFGKGKWGMDGKIVVCPVCNGSGHKQVAGG